MKIRFYTVMGAFIILCFTSCSHRLTGTWDVKKFETITPGEQNISLQNIGTMSFKSNGKGEKKLKYSVMGIQRDDVKPFTWSATESYITIDSKDSEVSKTWIFIENKKKHQVWKSTDGSKKIQTIELDKQ